MNHKNESFNEKKKIFFIAVTDEKNGNNRKYSDFVFELCHREFSNDQMLNEHIDLDAFIRHDMKTAVNIKKSLHESLYNSDCFIVLLDTCDGDYNPNVWFELGVISTYNKPIVLIAQEETRIPFDVNDIKVLRIPIEVINEVDLKSRNKIDASIVYDAMDKRKIVRSVKKFSKEFVNTINMALNSGNPFSHWYDSWGIECLGFQSITDLFERTGIISFIKDPGVRAEFISSEREAFIALITEVNNAKHSLRTTRFANQSIVSGERKNSDVHNEFMNALYNASKRDLEICDRIVCNNDPSKWFDILQVLVKSDSKMRVFVPQNEYRTGFELVVIDEKVAFIHFYQIDNNGDKNDNGDRYSHDIEVINSTLKIYGETVCKKLANIFDRLHHIDFDTDCIDPSRTLLGIPKQTNLNANERKRGVFQLKFDATVENDVILEHQKTERAINLFKEALKEWDFENKKDKIILAAGICLVDSHFINELSNYFDNKDDITSVINEVEKRMPQEKKKK